MRFFWFLFFPFFLWCRDPALLSFGAGVFEIVRHNRHETAEFRAEYKSSLNWYTVRPQIGFLLTIKGSTYLCGGFGLDWVIKDRLVFSPNFAAGWYRPGGGKDLGYALEFRSGVECAWQFKSKARLGLFFYHLSNASLGRKNPGEESLEVFFSIPINSSY